MSYIKKFKNKLSKNIENDMTRLRSKPRIFDYCYISTSNNLATLKKGLHLFHYYHYHLMIIIIHSLDTIIK